VEPFQHFIAHFGTLNPNFYGDNFIAQSNRNKKTPYKDREVANGVKMTLMMMFPTSLQTNVREEFASFVVGLDDYSNTSTLDEKSTMTLFKWRICHGADGIHLQNIATHILSQLSSSS
jgi:hypothetical protein